MSGYGDNAVVSISNSKFIIVFSDSTNSTYTTSTILTVMGNQIAGSFSDESKEAIALQPGTAGQNIDIILSGVAELSGITAGTEIASPGVYGYCPIDGWVDVISEWNSQVTAVNYIGTGVATSEDNEITITFPFTPSIVFIQSTVDNIETAIIFYGVSTFIRSIDLTSSSLSRDNFKALWNGKSLSFYTTLAGSTSLNRSNETYKVTAIRGAGL